MKTKLVLFDGNALMHRAYHALPPSLTTESGEPINAVYGLVSMLLRIIQDQAPTYIAFTFDRPEPTFRKEILKNYQAQRPEMEENLSRQFQKVRDVLGALEVPIWEKAGFEADDVIGTIAKEAKVDEVVVVTGDRDMLQLVGQGVSLYMPEGGMKNGKLYARAETIEKMGVPPERIVDYKALVGDPSDNYKGVPGVGPKTATALLERHGSFKNIYKNLGKIDERVASKLREHKKSAETSYRLAQIVTNVPVKFNLKKAGKWRVDSDKALSLFSEYGFRTLTKRAQEVGKTVRDKDQMSLL